MKVMLVFDAVILLFGMDLKKTTRDLIRLEMETTQN